MTPPVYWVWESGPREFAFWIRGKYEVGPKVIEAKSPQSAAEQADLNGEVTVMDPHTGEQWKYDVSKSVQVSPREKQCPA